MYTALVSLLVLASGHAATLPVGSGKSYSSPCAAIARALPGDTIEVDPDVWINDSCIISTPGLTIRTTGSARARIEASDGAPLAGGKAILLVDAGDVTIEGLELHGAATGAAIHVASGHGLTLRNCHLHDNHSGLVIAGGATSQVHIEASEFARNGTGHNIDIGPAASLTLRFSYSHHASHGHLVRSRAAENHILYNRLTQESGPGLAPLSISSGRSLLIGNIVQRASESVSACMLDLGPAELHAVGNTFVNDGAECELLAAPSATLRNNIFQGPGWTGSPENFSGDAAFANAAAHDYRLRPESGAIDSAVPATLQPESHYVHPLCGAARVAVHAPDMGAFEYGGPEAVECRTGRLLAGSDQSPEARATAPNTLIALSTASARPGATTDVNLFLFNVASTSAAVQWTLNYPQAAFDTIQLKAGPAALAAGKNVYCTPNDGRSMTCQLTGSNTNTIRNGIIAVVTFRLSQNSPAGASVPVTLTRGVSATVLGDVIPSRTMNGSVSTFRSAATPLL